MVRYEQEWVVGLFSNLQLAKDIVLDALLMAVWRRRPNESGSYTPFCAAVLLRLTIQQRRLAEILSEA